MFVVYAGDTVIMPEGLIMTHELKAYGRTLAKSMEELWTMNNVLRDDISALLDAFGGDQSNPVLRRSLVRASWAYIEGLVYRIKKMTLSVVDLGSFDIAPKDRQFLTEAKFDISSKGNVKIKSTREGAVDNIQRTFELSTQCFSLGWTPLFDDVALDRINAAIQLRNQVVHPKSAVELAVTDTEWDMHLQAFEWFSTMYGEYFLDMLKCHGSSADA